MAFSYQVNLKNIYRTKWALNYKRPEGGEIMLSLSFLTFMTAVCRIPERQRRPWTARRANGLFFSISYYKDKLSVNIQCSDTSILWCSANDEMMGDCAFVIK